MATAVRAWGVRAKVTRSLGVAAGAGKWRKVGAYGGGCSRLEADFRAADKERDGRDGTDALDGQRDAAPRWRCAAPPEPAEGARRKIVSASPR